jgi:hypothetical protein
VFWLRGTPHTLEILQSLGSIYHIDDVSRDEPFLIKVREKPFAVMPYTPHRNGIVDYGSRYFSTSMYADEGVYAGTGEAASMRRLMAANRSLALTGFEM